MSLTLLLMYAGRERRVDRLNCMPAGRARRGHPVVEDGEGQHNSYIDEDDGLALHSGQLVASMDTLIYRSRRQFPWPSSQGTAVQRIRQHSTVHGAVRLNQVLACTQRRAC
jgi:hypothetical protein